MAKVTRLTAGTSSKDFGEFFIEHFSMFEVDDLAKYAALRNEMADSRNGIKLETMREYSRKTTTSQGDGADRIFTTTEEIILVVSYWKKPVARHKGEIDDDDVQNEKARLVVR